MNKFSIFKQKIVLLMRSFRISEEFCTLSTGKKFVSEEQKNCFRLDISFNCSHKAISIDGLEISFGCCWSLFLYYHKQDYERVLYALSHQLKSVTAFFNDRFMAMQSKTKRSEKKKAYSRSFLIIKQQNLKNNLIFVFFYYFTPRLRHGDKLTLKRTLAEIIFEINFKIRRDFLFAKNDRLRFFCQSPVNLEWPPFH
ncbi:hypothetical protein BpHYR1_001494 [Brachionus plicatilis]|uniref:Uncharacterized protein n=1 Tax=Brachionus plicatilis TaxID=10195 RepID=A0A3M7QDU8_BRAPC|nr:hypothetical protein BpHYR1_001494 [Brachionus plicatilis]